ASVHLNYRGTPDLTFDATLTARQQVAPPPPPPPPPMTTPTTLVGPGSAWIYRYDNTTLPTTWNTPAFDAST
ncbi:hypothetical protein ASF38_15675, partial [Aeromicrobium sp. Leaf272]